MTDKSKSKKPSPSKPSTKTVKKTAVVDVPQVMSGSTGPPFVHPALGYMVTPIGTSIDQKTGLTVDSFVATPSAEETSD